MAEKSRWKVSHAKNIFLQSKRASGCFSNFAPYPVLIREIGGVRSEDNYNQINSPGEKILQKRDNKNGR